MIAIPIYHIRDDSTSLEKCMGKQGATNGCSGCGDCKYGALTKQSSLTIEQEFVAASHGALQTEVGVGAVPAELNPALDTNKSKDRRHLAGLLEIPSKDGSSSSSVCDWSSNDNRDVPAPSALAN
jgi:hypothetical protein